jgi:ATP synthase protein I
MQREHDYWRKRVERQASRIKKAERDRLTLMSQTIFVGTLGLVFVLPVVIGAYLGNWLDHLVEGYSVRWTVSLILLGVMIGVINVYLLMRE